MHLPLLVFDIETVPDRVASKRLYDETLFDGLADVDIDATLEELRQQDLGHDFPRLPFHEVVCLSGFWVTANSMRLFSLSQQDMSEREIIEKFLATINQHTPILVSWNGQGFDIPVLLYRAMHYELSAPALMDQGDINYDTKFANYQHRYHTRHIDLMDRLARFNSKYFQKLDHVAKLFDLPGKIDQAGNATDGHSLRQMVQQGEWARLTSYCESDVLNTWLIYLRWQKLKGLLTDEQYHHWQQKTRACLTETAPQQSVFLSRWQ